MNRILIPLGAMMAIAGVALQPAIGSHAAWLFLPGLFLFIAGRIWKEAR